MGKVAHVTALGFELWKSFGACFFIVFFLFLKPTARSQSGVEVLLAVGLRERKAEKLPRCFSLLLAKLN